MNPICSLYWGADMLWTFQLILLTALPWRILLAGYVRDEALLSWLTDTVRSQRSALRLNSYYRDGFESGCILSFSFLVLSRSITTRLHLILIFIYDNVEWIGRTSLDILPPTSLFVIMIFGTGTTLTSSCHYMASNNGHSKACSFAP